MLQFLYTLVQLDEHDQVQHLTYIGPRSDIPSGWSIARRSPCMRRASLVAVA